MQDLSAAAEATGPVLRARLWLAERLEGRVLLSTGTVLPPTPITSASFAGVVVHPAVANGIWDGGGDGISWSDPRNWSNDTLPTAADNVVISAGSGVTIFHGTGSDTVNSISSTSPISVANPSSLSVNAASTLNGLNLSGSWGGSGDVTVNGTFNLTNGVLNGGGTVRVPAGSVLNITGDDSLSGSHLVLAGTARFSGNILRMASAELDVLSGATFDLQGDGTFHDESITPSLVDNEGQISKSAGTGVSSFGVSLTGGGAMLLHSGGLRLAGTSASVGGAVTIDAGASLFTQIGSGGANFASTAPITNNGTLQFEGGTTTINSSLTGSGITHLVGGNLNLNVPGGLSLANFTQDSGNLTLFNDLAVTGTYNWQQGSLSGPASLHLPSLSTLNLTGDDSFINTHLFLFGTANFSGNILRTSGGSEFDVMPGATFDIQGNGTVHEEGITPSIFVNQGIIRKSSGSGTTSFSVNLSGGGQLQVLSGGLNLDPQTATLGGVVTVATGASLFTQTGSPGVTFTSSSSLNSTGTLEFDGGTTTINGAVSSTGATHLVGGNLNLNIPGGLTLGSLAQDNGNLTTTTDLTVTGVYNWVGGALIGPGALRLPLVSTLNLTSDNTFSGVHVFLNGTTNFSGGILRTNGGSEFDVLPGATFDIQGNGTIHEEGITPSTFVNQGVIRKSSGTGTSSFSVNLSGGGQLQVLSGGLNLTAQSMTIGGVVTVGTGASLFTQTGNAGVTFSSASSINSTGTLEFDGGTTTINGLLSSTGVTHMVGGNLFLNVPGGLTLANFAQDNGGVTLSSDLTVTGTYIWQNGSLSGPGALRMPSGSTLNLTNDVTFSGVHAFLNGVTDLTGVILRTTGGSELDILPGALFDIQGNGTLHEESAFASLINNQGIFRKSSGSGSSSISVNLAGAGQIQILSGNIMLSPNTATIDGLVTIAAGASLLTQTGTPGVTFSSTSSVTNNGVLEFDGGTTTFNGALTSTGVTHLVGGSLFFNSPGGVTLVNFTQDNGGLSTATDLTVTGTYNWQGGSLGGTGILRLPVGSTLNVTSDATLSGRHVILGGSANLVGSLLRIGGGSEFDVLPGATFDMQANASVFDNGGSTSLFKNQGTLKKSTGTGTSRFTLPLPNQGDVFVHSGILSLEGTVDQLSGSIQLAGGELDLSSPMTLDGGILTGSGTVAGSVNNNAGTVSLNRPLTITGSYIQSPSATLRAEIDGVAPGQFGQLMGNGAVLISGALNVTLGNGFVPAVGNTFQIIAEPSISGTFTSTTLPAIPGGHLTVSQTTGSVVVSAIPFNGTWTGSGDGHSWSDPNNWSNGVLPGPGDDVVINDPHGNTVTHDTTNDTVHSVTAITPLALGGGVTLTLLANSTATTFTQANGNLAGAGNLSISSVFNWAGGSETGSGTTSLAQGSFLNFTGASLDGRHLVIAGSANLIGGLLTSSGAVIDVTSTGSIDMGDNQIISYNGGAQPSLNVAGVLKKSTGPGTSFVEINLNDTGSIQISSGSLSIRGDQATVAGPVLVQAGTSLINQVATAMTFAAGSDIQSNGTVVFTPDGTVTLNGAFSNTGTTEFHSGSLVVNMPGGLVLPSFLQSGGVLSGGDVTVSGPYTWTAGTQTGSGTTFVPQEGSLILTNSTILDGRHLSVSGVMTLGGSLADADAARIDINPTGVLDIAGNEPMSQFFGARTTLNVAGMLKKSAGNGEALVDVELNVTGAIQTNSGTLHLRSDVASVSGSLSVAAGATFLIDTGTSFTFTPTSSVSGAGTVQVRSFSPANFNSGVYSPALTELDFGTLVIGAPGGLVFPNFTQNGGTLTGGDLTVNGPFLWTGGTQAGPGTTFIPQGQTLTMTTSQVANGRHLSIAGTATQSGFFVAEGGAVIDITPTGLFNFTNQNGIATVGAITTTLNNAGTIEKSAGANESAFSINFNNSGSLKIQAGSIHLQGAFDQTAGTTSLEGGNLQGDSLLHFDGGKLTGAGTVFGSLDNAANISLASTLTVTGTYTQEPAGTLNIELDGSAPGQFGQLVAGGGAAIAGALNVTLGTAFIPGGGASFQILAAPNITGAFTSTNLPTSTGGHLSVSQTGTSITINSATANAIWTGNGDGHSWSDPNNWSNNVLPGPADDVIINDTHGQTVVHDTGNDTVHSITASTPLTLSGGTLTPSADSNVVAFNQTGGTLAGSGILTVSILLNWSGGAQSGSGITRLATGAVGNLTGSETLNQRTLDVAAVDVTNEATIDVTGAGLQVTGGGRIQVEGTLTLHDNASVVDTAGTAQLILSGLLLKGGTGLSEVRMSISGNGGIALGGGTLLLDGAVSTFVGEVDVQFGELDLAPTTSFTFGPDAVIENISRLIFAGGITTIDGEFNGTVTDPQETINGFTKLQGGQLVLNHDTTLPNFDQEGGVLSGTGNLTVTNQFNWSGGSETGPGKTLVHTQAIGPKAFITGGELFNRQMDLAGDTQVSGTGIVLGPHAILNVQGFFTLMDNAGITHDQDYTSVMNMAGEFVKVGGTSTVDVNFISTGEMVVGSGTLELEGDQDSFINPDEGLLQIQGGEAILAPKTSMIFAANAGIENLDHLTFASGTITVNCPFTASTTLAGGAVQNGQTSIIGGTLILNHDASIPLFAQTGGTLDGSSTLTVTSEFDWSGGSETGTGTTTVSSTAKGNFTGLETLRTRTLQIDPGFLTGVVTLTGTALQMGDGSVFNVDGELDILGEADITIAPGSTAIPVILLGGGILKGQAGVSEIDVPMLCTGGIVMGGGTLEIDGSGTDIAGSVEVQAGLFRINASVTFDPGSTLENYGGVEFANGTTDFQGTYTDNFTQTNGSLKIGTNELSGGTLLLNHDATLINFTQSGGTLGGSANLTVTSQMDWSGGSETGTGTTSIPHAATLALNNDLVLNRRHLEIAGTATLESGQLTIDNAALIHIANGGVFDIPGDFSLPFDGQGTLPSISVDGLLKKSDGSGTSQLGGNLDNFGTVSIDSGVLAVGGAYTQHSIGTLALQLSGTQPGHFGKLTAANASLAGTFNVTLAPGYTPSSGDAFDVIDATPVTGSFLPVNLPSFNNGHLSLTQSPTNVVLNTAGNQAPVAGPDSAATVANSPVPIDVLLNDFDPDGDPLSILTFSQGSSGTVTPGGVPGRLIYTPSIDANYTDTFTYTLSDGHGGIATGVVTVQVSATTSGGTDANSASTALASGLTTLGFDLGNWGNLFSLSGSGAFLPVVGTNLSSLFALGGPGGIFAHLGLPTLTPVNTYSALAQELTAAGFVVDFTQGGGATSSDLVQAHFDKIFTPSDFPTLAPSGNYDPSTNSILGGLPLGDALGGLMHYLGSLRFHLGIGVDSSGFYVTSDSGAELDFTGSGNITGSTPAGSQPVTSAGNAQVNYQAMLFGPAGSRVHISAPSFAAGSFLQFNTGGSASVSSSLQYSPVDVNLSASWNLTLANNQVTNNVAQATGLLSIPNLTKTQNGVDVAEDIALSVVFNNGVWTVDGSITPASQSKLEGFSLDSLHAHATLNNANVSGTIDGQLSVTPEAASPVVFNFSSSFDNQHFTFTGNVAVNESYIGLNVTQDLLWVHQATYGLSINSVFGASTDVSVSVDADIAVVLPQHAPAGTVPQGPVRVNGFSGTLDSDGKLHLSANSFTVTATNALVITGGLVTLDIDPNNTDPNFVIASLHTLVIRPAAFSAASANTLDLLQIRRNGFDLVDHLALPDGTLSNIASITGVVANLDLHDTTGTLTGSIGLTAATGSLFVGGLASVHATGLSGSIDISTGDVTLGAQTVDVLLNNLLDVNVSGGTLHFGSGVTTVLHLDSAIATIPGIAGLDFEVDNLDVHTDGTFAFSTVTVKDNGGLLQTIALGGLLPFDITEVQAQLTNPADLSTLALTVKGTFDFSGLSLPFTPVVQVGTAGNNTFQFALDINQLKNGIIAPQNFGPVTIGFSGLNLGPATLGGTLELGSFTNGSFGPIGGSVTVGGSLSGISGNASVGLSGTFTNTTAQSTLNAHGSFNLSFNLGGGAIVVNNADLEFGLKLINSPTTGHPVNFSIVPSLDGLNIGGVSLDLGDLVTLSATNVNINFAAPSGQPLVQFGSLSVLFKQGIDFLNGWGGTATNFGIGSDGSIYLVNNNNGPSITLNVSPNANFGLPFPFHAEKVGIVFHPGFFDTGPNGKVTGATRIADPTAIGILFSGGLFASGEFPFNASVQNVELDLNALRNNRFPLTNISGGGFGLEPVSLPPLAPVITVAGFLNFGQTPAGNYYLDIGGDFGIQGLGEIGGRLIVSQFGPVAGEVTVPTAVPIGPSGLVLTSVTGGLVFGQAPKTIANASQLTRSDIPGLPPGITASAIAQLVDTAAGHDFWQVPFTVALQGQIIALEAPGMMNINVGLALNTGGQFAGFGELDTLGIPFADALMLLDLSSTDPKIFARVTSPNPGNPLGFILPDRTDFQFTFDGTGLTEGLVFGFRTFLQRALTGTQAVANGFIGQLLDSLAASLQADRSSPLAQQLLAGNTTATIDRQFLLNRLLALLPQGGLSNVEANLQSAANLAQAVIKQLMDTAGKFTLDPNSLPTSEASIVQGVVSLVNLAGQSAGALAALIANFKDAALAGASAFESVFNPLIDIGGDLQPIVLGIPFGPPVAGAHMSITKGGLVFGANVSPSGLLDATLSNTPGISSVWDTLKFLMPLPFALGGTEHLSANVELPLPGSFLTLANGQFAPIDPFSPSWLVSIGGSVSPYGIQLASITGAAFSGGNAAASTLFQVAANFSDAFNPVDPTKIIVSSQQRLNLIEALGGIILNSQVLLPSLLMDPGNVFAALPPLPSDPLQLPGYIADLATKLSSYTQAGRVQFYIPSPQSLLQYNLTNFTSDTDRLSPSTAFLSLTPAQQAAALQNLIDSAYLEGVLNAKILGIQLAAGVIEASPTQFSLSGAIPWLANLQTSFGISFAPRPVPVSSFVTLMGRQPNANELNPDGTDNIQLPVVSALASINTTTTLTSILTAWGLPAKNFVPLLPAIGAQFRAYSPAFDPTSSDPLLRNGGIEFDSDLNLPGVINSASFKFALTPPTGSAVIPDFVATTQVSSLKLAGLVINNATVKIIKVGASLTVSVDGSGSFLGTAVHIHGILNPDFTGNLSIDAATPNGFIVDGFSLSASLTMKLTRQGNRFTGVATFNSLVTLPSWLSSASGQATANASGTISSTGDFNLNLSINNFAVGSNTGISLVSSTGTGPATFTLVRTSGVTTVGISGGIKYGAATGLPLMAITGSLSSAGSGNLAITFNGTGLNLNGFLVTGGATLAYSPNSFTITVNGHLTVGSVVNNATVTGAITQTGIAQLSLTVGSINLNPLTVHSFTLTLNRIGTTGLSYKLHAQVTVDIPDVITNATVTGDLDSSAFGSLSLSATQVTIFGFTLNNGAFSVIRASTGSSFSASATLSFLGQTLTVTTPTPLTISGSGLTGSMSLTVNGGGKFGFDGWSVGGTLTLAVTPGSASLSITNGSLTIPNLFTNLAVSGSLNSAGLGSLTVGSPSTVIHPGGANSPFTVTGTYTLSRLGSPPVTTFSANNASFTWTGVTTLTVPTFSASSNGQFNVTINPINLTLATGGMSFNMGTVSLIADVGGLNLRLHFGGATLSIPNVATGANALTIPAFDVNTTGNFSVTLTAGQLDFGAVLITGRLVFQRQNGVFSLSINDLTNGASPRLVIGGFANIVLDNFVIASDGTFNVTATATRIGPNALSIRNASISVKKTGAALSTFSISVVGGQLFLPLGDPVDLPTITINNNASFSRSVTIPQLNLGPAFSTTASATFTLSLANDVLDLSLNNPVGINVLAGSVGMQLKTFDAASDGTFTGTVSGQLKMLGYTLASATFNVTLNNGVVRMTLPANKAASVNLGFITVKVSGFVSSDGHFSFTGSTSVSVSAFGVGSASGTATFTLSDSGFSGRFLGTVSALGVTLASAGGTIDSSGILTVIIGGIPVTWQL